MFQWQLDKKIHVLALTSVQVTNKVLTLGYRVLKHSDNWAKYFFFITIHQGCTTQVPWRAKKSYCLVHVHVFTHTNDVFYESKIMGFAGQIKSSRGPLLANGPYVVHAYYSTHNGTCLKLFANGDF
jgi:hypothetical protein